MNKSENKIKPMSFWSDGYKEYGLLEPDPKRIKDDELVDITEDNVPEYVFEPPKKCTKRSAKRKSLKGFVRSLEEKMRQNKRYTRG